MHEVVDGSYSRYFIARSVSHHHPLSALLQLSRRLRQEPGMTPYIALQQPSRILTSLLPVLAITHHIRLLRSLIPRPPLPRLLPPKVFAAP